MLPLIFLSYYILPITVPTTTNPTPSDMNPSPSPTHLTLPNAYPNSLTYLLILKKRGKKVYHTHISPSIPLTLLPKKDSKSTHHPSTVYARAPTKTNHSTSYHDCCSTYHLSLAEA